LITEQGVHKGSSDVLDSNAVARTENNEVKSGDCIATSDVLESCVIIRREDDGLKSGGNVTGSDVEKTDSEREIKL